MKNMEEVEEHRHDDDIVNTKVLEVIWRGKKLSVEIESRATLKDFGDKLQKLTNIKSHTMRFLLPNKILMPFSHQHSNLTLQEETFILKAKSIRMMGVLEHEIEEVLQSNAKEDSRRIAGFDEEEKRLRQRMSDTTTNQTKLPPQGNYIFSHFRTLHIPGLQLNPPASEALKRMHRLAADPGIIAIMNKHRWRVGIMTEMAPVGYVGISPKCILGFNKNHGEEISLRLRTDDLKGFRKYESIKKTLLHELAHMVHSEHDANFYALDKQLNEEAASLDWTRSRSHTLGGHGRLDHYEEFEEYYDGTGSNSAQKLGGKTSEQLASARASSVAAAYRRLVNVPENSLEGSKVHEEQDTGDSAMEVKIEVDKGIESEPNSGINGNRIISELDDVMTTYGTSPDEVVAEPDPDESMTIDMALNSGVVSEPDPDENNTIEHVMKGTEVRKSQPGPDEANEINKGDSDSRGNVGVSIATSIMKADDLDIDDSEMRRIQDPVAEICTRLQNTIETLRSEVGDYAATVLQTLFKIIRNVIEHPNEMKFKRLRKANPHFQRNVANYKGAMEVLYLVGFNEDVVADEIGRVETYIVLKRNDPGLLWLAKSSLEMCIAH